LSLRLLHYSAPIAVVLLAVALSITSACIQRPSKRSILNLTRHNRSKWIALATATLYIGEGLAYIIQTSYQEHCLPAQDALVYLTLSGLVWLGFYFSLNDTDTVYRFPYAGSWALATILEIIICVLHFHTPSVKDLFHGVQRGVQVLRVFCLVGICWSIAFQFKSSAKVDVESQPLLQSQDAEYGSTQKSLIEAEEDDEDVYTRQRRSLREEHRQRLESVQGWWGYLRQFRIFIPHLVPMNNRRLQSYAVLVALLVICDRIANVLGPQLLGDIVNRIARMEGNDEIPWRQILFFTIVIKIPHDHILTPLKSCLSVRLYYWSYQSLVLSSISHIMGLSLDFHENQGSGEVREEIRQGEAMNNLFDEFMNKALPLVLDVVVAFIYLSWLFSVSLGLVLAVVYVSYVIITYKTTIWTTNRRRQYLGTQVEVQSLMDRCIANWQTNVYFNRQEYLLKCLAELVGREVIEMATHNDLSHVKNVAQGVVMTLGYGAVLLLAAQQMKDEKQPVGNMVTLLLYWHIITRPLFTLANSYKDIANYLVNSERLLQLTQKAPTVTDADGARDLDFRGGKIEYRDVRFSYEDGNPILKGLNFTIEPGSTVAFVGATGSGKSTTCDKLLFRMYDVTEGSILIDDQDVRDVTQFSIRETLGIVRQDQTLFNDTLVESVRFARLDATDEEVFEACKNARIHDKIITFPKGYQSKIGERGVKLSGGEKQRLFIAQLFLRDPRIVVLDEATSTVDNLTEEEIQESFARICKGRTTVIVAHRLSTVKEADQIFVLDRGQIVEQGTHDELLRLRGKYFNLWA
ncbi:hypothetical protein K504DRAFT_353493, partial [Pleomassaria siparia CBS 279.74]